MTPCEAGLALAVVASAAQPRRPALAELARARAPALSVALSVVAAAWLIYGSRELRARTPAPRYVVGASAAFAAASAAAVAASASSPSAGLLKKASASDSQTGRCDEPRIASGFAMFTFRTRP